MTRRFLTGLAAGALAALAAAPAAGAAQVRFDLAPGQLVQANGVGAKVPPPGKFVYAEALGENGASDLSLTTRHDGGVIVDAGGGQQGGAFSDDIGGSLSPRSAPGPCNDSAYNWLKLEFSDGTTKKFRWNRQYEWRFNNSSTPSEISQSGALEDLKQATTNITHAKNDCGFGDNVGATHQYLGTTDRGVNIDANLNCLSPDGVNVSGFGPLNPVNKLAYACVWGDKNPGGEWAIATESDVRFDKDNHSWYTGSAGSGCSGKWSVEGVGTHERGHTFSLGHVGEADHGNLTMSTSMEGTCKKPEATLGRGDVIGLETAY